MGIGAGHILPQFCQPYLSLGIAGRTPIASRGQRSARANLGAVRNRRTFELAELEKSMKKYLKPFLYRTQVVCKSLFQGNQIRPVSSGSITPGMIGQKRDFAGTETV